MSDFAKSLRKALHAVAEASGGLGEAFNFDLQDGLVYVEWGGGVKRQRDLTPCRHRELTPVGSLGRSAFLDRAGLVHQASPALGP